MPRCFVMQPFDGGQFDKRYDEIYKLAIEEAGFEPYRVDKDPSTAILIEYIERGIRDSVACFVDITIDNPNVWFELGFALCANKPICLVCSQEREKFPFDIQHRKIIRYKMGSPSDFQSLHASIVESLKAIQAKDETIEKIIKEPETLPHGDLGHLEFSVLCIIFENQDADDTSVSAWSIANDMERLGYTNLATKVALKGLARRRMITVSSVPDQNNEGSYNVYRMMDIGISYIMDNVHNLELRKQRKRPSFVGTPVTRRPSLVDKPVDIDDDIPF